MSFAESATGIPAGNRLGPITPCLWIPVPVQNGNDKDAIVFEAVIDDVRKLPKRGGAHLVTKDRINLWVIANEFDALSQAF